MNAVCWSLTFVRQARVSGKTNGPTRSHGRRSRTSQPPATDTIKLWAAPPSNAVVAATMGICALKPQVPADGEIVHAAVALAHTGAGSFWWACHESKTNQRAAGYKLMSYCVARA